MIELPKKLCFACDHGMPCSTLLDTTQPNLFEPLNFSNKVPFAMSSPHLPFMPKLPMPNWPNMPMPSLPNMPMPSLPNVPMSNLLNMPMTSMPFMSMSMLNNGNTLPQFVPKAPFVNSSGAATPANNPNKMSVPTTPSLDCLDDLQSVPRTTDGLIWYNVSLEAHQRMMQLVDVVGEKEQTVDQLQREIKRINNEHELEKRKFIDQLERSKKREKNLRKEFREVKEELSEYRLKYGPIITAGRGNRSSRNSSVETIQPIMPTLHIYAASDPDLLQAQVIEQGAIPIQID